MSFSVRTCKNTTFNGNKCAPQSVIDAAFNQHINFYLTASFVNPVINPNQKEGHIEYYLE